MEVQLVLQVLLLVLKSSCVCLADDPPYVWPSNLSPPSYLTPEQLDTWERDGVLVVPNAVRLELVAAAAAAIRSFVGADPHVPSTWYKNTLDIYKDRLPSGAKPHHGPCGMAWLNHHSSLWALRQEPRLHRIFADLYGTHQLYVTADRVHFKPPQHAAYPAWSDPGDVHHGLHWDTDVRRVSWPVPYAIQGVIYLENTSAQQGALRVVPGFHRRFQKWAATHLSNETVGRPDGKAEEMLLAEAVPIEGEAGSLAVWHSLLPHGPAPNLGLEPRISAYVTMLPVNATAFLGPGRSPGTPLNMVDAGTLRYLPAMIDSSTCFEDAILTGAEGKSGYAHGSVQRQSRHRRTERWKYRLPLLDEDPKEDELPHRPPGEEDGQPAELTELGKRLVGLVEWEENSVMNE